MKDNPPDRQFLILLFLGVIFLGSIICIPSYENALRSQNRGQLALSECFIRQSNIPFYFEEDRLIACLIKHESNGNPNAVGDNGKAKGILQFHDSTFQMYCVEKYGLTDDIWNPIIQKECCANMIAEGQLKHWSARKYCVSE